VRIRRGLGVLFAVTLGVAVIGFFAGTRRDAYERQTLAGYVEPDRPVHPVEPARSYGELATRPFERNLHITHALEQLARRAPDPFAPFERTEAARVAALEARAALRAYDGAPPTIPHPVAPLGAPACLACHGTGLEIDGRRAPRMSHALHASCTQCHVPADSPLPFAEAGPEAIPLGDPFVGHAFGRGEPATPGAPAPIPHPVQMRTDCLSCHGVLGREGIRTTHPWRESCTQCHAPSGILDGFPTSDVRPFGG
jgi:nitrate reductase (cytochrome), electron transfer subunit